MESFRAGKYEVAVLYLDNHLLAVAKPPNMPSQADESGDIDLLTACKGYIAEKFAKPGAAYLGLVHRLDRPAGGVMLLARTSKAAARLSAAFAGHDIEKIYLALLEGRLSAPMKMEDMLVKDARTGMVRVTSAPGGKIARLESFPLAYFNGLTLAKVELETGRPHQIRVQHASRELPLYGDARYGNGAPGRQLALWAHRLTVTHPTRGEKMTFVSAPPTTGAWADFGEALKRLAREESET